MDQHQDHTHAHQGVTISMEKDSLANARSLKQRHSIQRALGFKNIVIYVLVFINLLLCSKLFSTWSRQQPQSGSFFLTTSQNTLAPEEPPHEGGEDASTPEFWIKMALIVFLVLIGGLTIGLMGLDETNLHVLMASGTPAEQVHAETVYKLLSRGKHWVLVTLLLGNVIVNETLPVVLDSELGGGVVAILISTLLIVVFGEIIPQAVCARYGLAIGSYCAKPMLVFMYIMSPIAYPIAMLLDSWLGVHHGTTYRRTELKTLVSLHQVDGIGELTDDEVTIIASVLDLKEKSVASVMTPLEDVFTLSEDAILDEHLMEEIVSAGYSRIPIYRHDDPHNFIGMLLVKRLITYDPEDHIPVRQFTINSLPEAAPNTSCLDILNFFQEGRSHMAIVTSEPGGFGLPVGVITLEDVIEELLGEEIVDESDVYVDIHNKIRVIRKPSRNVSMIKNLKTLLRSPAMSDSTPLLGRTNSTDRQSEHAYMSTGKTILQSRKSSVGKMDTTTATAANTAANTAIPPTDEHPFKTGSIPKDIGFHGTTANGNKDAPVVNFKDGVEVIKDGTTDNGAANGASHRPTTTVIIDETQEPASIKIAPEDPNVTTTATTAVSEPVSTPSEVTTAAVQEVTPAPVEEAPVMEAQAEASSSSMPASQSTATVTALDDNTNSPSPSSSKKKKNKKKKSNK
ncbi:hypothetical protein BGZ70_009984 [Mortierella alpina]|uniref:DUF21-domain-containing protein n=1 Tax=Mortierella alpina TaxID=64518 RepID=A0A9P6J0A3_MORAP|nr:hypothetical protein BGZ70_009984 [Mortierella alpina]